MSQSLLLVLVRGRTGIILKGFNKINVYVHVMPRLPIFNQKYCYTYILHITCTIHLATLVGL